MNTKLSKTSSVKEVNHSIDDLLTDGISDLKGNVTGKMLLTDGRRLKAYIKSNLDFKELTKLHATVNSVYDEIIEDLKKEEEERIAHQKIVEECAEMIKSTGVSVAEIVEALGVKVNATEGGDIEISRPPKYEYYVDGKRKTWTGIGKTPNAIKNEIEKNHKTLSDFLI